MYPITGPRSSGCIVTEAVIDSGKFKIIVILIRRSCKYGSLDPASLLLGFGFLGEHPKSRWVVSCGSSFLLLEFPGLMSQVETSLEVFLLVDVEVGELTGSGERGCPELRPDSVQVVGSEVLLRGWVSPSCSSSGFRSCRFRGSGRCLEVFIFIFFFDWRWLGLIWWQYSNSVL